ncbi:transposase [Streptomyces sp. NPDC048825]|uniref:transposase n=1 Tax=Streptomyces sp. NPDC048825 TaxID=3365592 RepID=UPI003716819D
MAQVTAAAEVGHARYTYRLRVASAARTALAAEWDRCRWVWNECVAKSFRLKDGRLHLAGDIDVTVVWSRELPAEPSSVRVYQDSLGHWYCSFVVPAQAHPLPETGRVIGIDWGVKETATTTSDAHDLPHAEHGKKAQQKLTRYDRMMARRQPKKGQAGSKGYREAKKLRAKAHKKVARQREDTGRKWDEGRFERSATGSVREGRIQVSCLHDRTGPLSVPGGATPTPPDCDRAGPASSAEPVCGRVALSRLRMTSVRTVAWMPARTVTRKRFDSTVRPNSRAQFGISGNRRAGRATTARLAAPYQGVIPACRCCRTRRLMVALWPASANRTGVAATIPIQRTMAR